MDLPKDIYILILKPANMLTIWKKKKGGDKVADGIKIAYQFTLRWGECPGDPL